MQLIEELEDKYNQYTGKNFSFLSDRGILKTEISSLMLLYDTVYYNADDTIKFFLGSDYLNKPELLEVLKNPLKEFFGFYTQICFDIRYKEFIKIAAKIYFQCYKDSKDVAENENPELPKCEMDLEICRTNYKPVLCSDLDVVSGLELTVEYCVFLHSHESCILVCF